MWALGYFVDLLLSFFLQGINTDILFSFSKDSLRTSYFLRPIVARLPVPGQPYCLGLCIDVHEEEHELGRQVS